MKGRGSDHNPENPYLKLNHDYIDEEYIDEKNYGDQIDTTYLTEFPKNVLSKNDSPDIPFTYSINPYQGCEHGCIYCYARNSHTYWGFGAGLDFESKIIVKKNAPDLLEKAFLKKSWKPQTIVLSGNTDCYQPAERKYKLTRQILQICLRFGNPVGVITKNSLIVRDIDVLSELAKESLVRIYFSITTLNEDLRRKMEPRTTTSISKLKVIEKLSSQNIPVGVMMGPIIPGLNDHEIQSILKLASEAGAIEASYTMVRLNGQIGQLFESWLENNYPERKDKVLNKIRSLHSGQVNDTRWKTRMRGEGELADIIASMFSINRKKYFGDKEKTELRTDRFRRNGNLSLF